MTAKKIALISLAATIILGIGSIATTLASGNAQVLREIIAELANIAGISRDASERLDDHRALLDQLQRAAARAAADRAAPAISAALTMPLRQPPGLAAPRSAPRSMSAATSAQKRCCMTDHHSRASFCCRSLIAEGSSA